VASIDKETKLRPGDHAEFLFNTDRLHIFDADTEQAIR
jgi:hypothetical protein